MNHDFTDDAQNLGDGQIEELLDDIEMRCKTDVALVREHATHHLHVRTTIRPGNASARRSWAVNGETTEIRSQGATCLTDAPVGVGDVFQVAFDRSAFDVEPLLAICDRCTMLGEDRFEARFRFAEALPNPAQNRDQA